MLTTAPDSNICIKSSKAVLHVACRGSDEDDNDTYKGIHREYLSMLCSRPKHWVIAAETFLGVQGMTVQTEILPRELQGSRVSRAIPREL